MKNTFPRWLTVVLSFGMLVLLIGNAWFYHTQKQHLQQESVKELQAIAQLKVDQIAAWRVNQLANATVLVNSLFLIEGVARWMTDPHAVDAVYIRSRLRSLQEQYRYRDVLLVDAGGRVRMSLAGRSEPVHADVVHALAIASRDRKAVITDLHVGPKDPPHLDVITPLFAPIKGKPKYVGAVILRSDARQFLYPLIQSWPVPSRTAETLLVRRDGDTVLFLNDLRYRKDAALRMRISLSRTNVPAVMAVFGKEGVVEGEDYRGIKVLSVLKAIPDSPWFMVAKMDEAEIFEKSRFFSVLILALVLGLVAAGAAAVGVVWQRNAKAQYRTLFRAEEARRMSEERHRITLMSVGDGVIATDAQGRVELLNPVTETLTGWSQDEARGRPLEEVFRIVNENTRKDVENPVRRVMREGLVVGLANHTLLIARDGTERPIADSGALIRDERNEIFGVVLVFRDQTEERAAERALHESEERYRGLFQHMREGFAYCKMFFENGEARDFVYLSVNDAFETLTGLTDVTGKRVSEVIPGIRSSDPGLFEIYGRVALTGTPEKFETFVEALHQWFSISVYCPEREYFVAVFDVITGRKRAEEEREKLEAQVRQAQKMEAVGRLAGGVAHDFNNMLTVITGYSELLLQKIGKESSMHGEVEEIKRAGERAASLTQQLLAFSRKQIIEPKVVHLDSLMAEMHKMLTRLIGEDIELQATTGKSLGSVKVDPGQFQQILMNLVVNARDAMPDGGKIVIETANVDLDEGYCALHPYVSPGRFVMLAVSDTGKGMSEEVKAHIFEPFFTTKEKGSGTGLGLATTFGAVHQAGGSIEVYSEVGVGTTFKIYLPRVEEEAVKPEKDDRPTDLPGGTETVLIVEDEGILRNLCVQILERLGYKVLRGSNGIEAIALAQGYGDRIDLLLTDVVMPGMSGAELATELVLLHPEMKVLFTSGYTDDAITRHGILDEGVSFIGKPYTPSALARKVREELDKA